MLAGRTGQCARCGTQRVIAALAYKACGELLVIGERDQADMNAQRRVIIVVSDSTNPGLPFADELSSKLTPHDR